MYGYGREEGATAFVSLALTAAVKGESFLFPTRWNSRLEYVEDVAEAFIQCIEAGWQGAGVTALSDELTTSPEIIAALSQCEPSARVEEPDELASRISRLDDMRTLHDIAPDWTPVPLRVGIEKTLAMHRRY